MVANIHKGYALTFHWSSRNSTHEWQPKKK